MVTTNDPLPPPEQKAAYVREMFGRIADHYDLMNRLMTLGRDQAWRRLTVAQALHFASISITEGAGDGEWRVLDVATGTADLAFEVLQQQPCAQVVGLDFALEMLELAQQKGFGFEVTPYLMAGDALRLPFADRAFDSVVTGFALRNVTDIPAAFAEMARVTRPGGRVACLEIAKPRLPLFRRLFALYFYRLVPLLGEWVSGERSAYTYLPHSLTAFLTPDEIVKVMQETGWCDVSYRRLMFGTVALHAGIRA
jgi:demethylmenaquinone methyltransferase/2-methoxy-6-polyprenyl-1,4-benzoquinol methylase